MIEEVDGVEEEGPPSVSDEDLLCAFEALCHAYGVVSRGFKPEDITAPIDGASYDGTTQWAIKHRVECGYMIVSGWHGCGAHFVRWNGYVTTRWDFLMMIEALTDAKYETTRST